MASFWAPRCIWPSEIEGPCEHDGEIQLCGETAYYIVDGYSYCEDHTKGFVKDNMDQAEARMNATPVDDGWVDTMTPRNLQDRTDDFLNGEWSDEISYNGGGDE